MHSKGMEELPTSEQRPAMHCLLPLYFVSIWGGGAVLKHTVGKNYKIQTT